MPSKRLVPTAILCAALAVGVTSCAGTKNDRAAAPVATGTTPAASPEVDISTLGADEIMKRAHAAMAAVTSFKVDGNLAVDGKVFSLSLAADKQGNCAGWARISGGQIDILRHGAQTWIKPDATYWKDLGTQLGDAQVGAAVAQQFKDHYLTGDQNDPDLKEAAGMCDMVNGIAKDNGPDGKVTKGRAIVANGVRAVSLTLTDTDGSTSTVYIAADGVPYVVELEQTTVSPPSRLNLSAFDKPVTVQAPAADSVIDYKLFQEKIKSL
ncbi:hypothetical protein GCM10009760_57770 [Kitasatospora kazusensis]|uniref:Lipoprotein n=1 Tax=Kitasatospora kazusensis TaxID=407974 RepID=A0ABP5LZ35_9ACTN